MTKFSAESARIRPPQIELGLVCDAGSSPTGLHGLTDLFRYASGFAAKRRSGSATAPVRITHWRSEDADANVSCIYDSSPRPAHALSALIIPGNERATLSPVRDNALTAWLRMKHAEGVVIAAVCGGVFILAKTGVLAGRQATTHWALREQFAAQFPQVLMETDRMVIDHGDVVTAGGVLAWADLGLRLTSRFLGPTVMLETAQYMNVDPPGREQCFYSGFEPPMKHGDQAILKAQLRLSAQRERPIAIADIARHTCLEPRTFLRRFVQATGMKPSEYQQRLRVSPAREMLEFSRKSVENIALSVGYEDLGGFRRVFRKIMGLTPSEYRRRFGGAGRGAMLALAFALASTVKVVDSPAAPPPTADTRPSPPTRSFNDAGAPPFTVISGAGAQLPDSEGNFVIGPDYPPPPEASVVDGVPQGKVQQFTMESADSRFFPGVGRDEFGTVDPQNPKTLIVNTHSQAYVRAITVYIPKQYKPGTSAPFIVVHDGPKPGESDTTLPRILDSLIARHRVPVMVAVMIQNGGGDAQGSERGLEYDTMSGKFAEFIEAEVLPAVEKTYNVKLTRKADGRAVMGCSSGAAAAFTMAWFHPEWYHRVISYSGTFVNQQWPFNPDTPGGAWEYHTTLIAQSAPKPLRIWMHVGDRDLFNPNLMRDDMHDWVKANHGMAKALKAKGYRYQYVFALNSGHCDRDVRYQTLSEALEWVWKGYR